MPDNKVNEEIRRELAARLYPKIVNVEPPSPIADIVRKLERDHTDAMELLGEIVASLNLEGNAHLFAEMPDDWHHLVEHWTKWWRNLKS